MLAKAVSSDIKIFVLCAIGTNHSQVLKVDVGLLFEGPKNAELSPVEFLIWVERGSKKSSRLPGKLQRDDRIKEINYSDTLRLDPVGLGTNYVIVKYNGKETKSDPIEVSE